MLHINVILLISYNSRKYKVQKYHYLRTIKTPEWVTSLETIWFQTCPHDALEPIKYYVASHEDTRQSNNNVLFTVLYFELKTIDVMCNFQK